MSDEVSEISNSAASSQALQDWQDVAQSYQDDLAVMNDKLDAVSNAVDSANGSNVDYSDALNQISQLLALQDLLLLVIAVMIFVGCGMFFGYMVVRWWRSG